MKTNESTRSCVQSCSVQWIFAIKPFNLTDFSQGIWKEPSFLQTGFCKRGTVVLFTWFLQPKGAFTIINLSPPDCHHINCASHFIHKLRETFGDATVSRGDLGLWCFITALEPYHEHSWAGCWWQRWLGKLPSKRGVIKKNDNPGLQQHSPKQHHYSVCVYGEEAGGFFAVLARGIGSMKVHTSVRAAAREGADYVKGTGEGWGRKEWELALLVAASCYFGAAAHGLQLGVLNST